MNIILFCKIIFCIACIFCKKSPDLLSRTWIFMRKGLLCGMWSVGTEPTEKQ